jgi:hypothetical protein
MAIFTFGCIQWECDLFNGRPKARCYPFNIQGHRFRNKNPKVHPSDLIDHNTKYSTLYRTLYHSLYRTVYHTQCFGSSYFAWAGLCLPGHPLPIQVGAVGRIRSYCIHGCHRRSDIWYARPLLFFNCTLEGWQLPMSTWLSHLFSSAPLNQSA